MNPDAPVFILYMYIFYLSAFFFFSFLCFAFLPYFCFIFYICLFFFSAFLLFYVYIFSLSGVLGEVYTYDLYTVETLFGIRAP